MIHKTTSRLRERLREPMVIKSLLTFMFFFIPLIIVVPILAVQNLKSKEGSGRGQIDLVLVNSQTMADVKKFNQDGVLLMLVNSGLDVTANTFKLNILCVPLNSLNSVGSGLNDNVLRVDAQFLRPVNISISGSTLLQQKANSSLLQQDIVLPFDSGDITMYPFDSYKYQMVIQATSFNRNGVRVDLPVFVSTDLFFPLFNAVATSETFDDLDARNIIFQFNRTTSTKVFSAFIMVLMWVLSSGMLTLATGIWIRGRTVEPPTIAASLALLFAIPNVRNAQPSISSSSGCVSDFLSFYWAMMLSSIAASLLLLNYILKYKAQKKEKESPFKHIVNSNIVLNKSSTAVAVDQV